MSAERVGMSCEVNTDMSSLKIRTAVKDDCYQLIQMILKQATAENTPEQVQTTRDTLVRDGFDSHPPFYYAIVAEKNCRTIGYAVYYFLYSALEGGQVMYLGELYVTSDCRGNGYGRRLFQELMDIAKAERCICMQWHVHDSNKDAMRFYERYGAFDLTLDKGVHNFRMEKDVMLSLLQTTSRK